MNRENKRPVTLEDLLRLKRTERPPAEFWSQFDRELRAKQLAAIVEKRPWWRQVSVRDVWAGFSRYHVPLGATAVLAITVLSVREYRRPSDLRAVEPAMKPVAANFDLAAITPVANSAEAISASVTTSVADGGARDGLAAVVTGNGFSPAGLEPAAETVTDSSERELTPTARFIATNLALANAAEPGIAQSMLGVSRSYETRAVPTRTRAIDPLAQMISPSDARRSRLLAASAVGAVSSNNAQPVRSTEVRPRRLSDEQLYDTVSRFGARGNSLLVKF